MKAIPQSQVREKAKEIFDEFLDKNAPCPVNVDSKSVALAAEAMQGTTISRWAFDNAETHVFHLMMSDIFPRYLRSDMYKEYLNGSKKKVKSIPNLFGKIQR
jgi:regulator of G-protein signaling